MKYIYSVLILLLSLANTIAQCETVDIVVSVGQPTTIVLFHPGFFNLPSGVDNVSMWEITNEAGITIHEAITLGSDTTQDFMEFNHSVPITETMEATVLITNETTGISCFLAGTLRWIETEIIPGVFLGSWQIDTNTGVPVTLALELISTTNVSCNGGNDGSIEVLATDGLEPYEYTINGGSASSSPFFSGLTAGLYDLSVTDALGVVVSMQVLLEESDALILDVSNTSLSCFGSNTGEIIAEASGGTSSNGYQYFINGDGPFASGVFTDLASGTYDIIVEDDNACLTEESIEVSGLEEIVVENITIVEVACYADSTGSVDFDVTGGSSPYTFQIEGQNTGLSLPISNLEAGSYSIIVTDQNACTSVVEVVVQSPDSLVLAIDNMTNDNCDESNVGSVRLIGVGGKLDYVYSLDGITNTSGVFEELAAGAYNAKVEDANGCIAELIVTIGLDSDFDVTYINTNPPCQGDSTGSISVMVDGGNVGFTFLINGIDNESSEFVDLTAGEYRITVQNDNGCSVMDTITLVDLSNLLVDTVLVSNVNCGTGELGVVQLIADGGAGDIIYWLDGQMDSTGVFVDVAAGSYVVNAMDSVGCTVEENVMVISTGEIFASIEMLQNISCFGQNDGEVVISVNGSNDGYAYQLDTMSNDTGVFADLAPGTYLVLISGVSNCTTEIEFTIEDADELFLELISVTNNDGTGNGTISVEGIGGASPYQYSIDGGVTFQDDPMFLGLEDEMYIVLIQDANGCTNELAVLVGTTSTSDIGLLSSVKIYPSPTQVGTELNVTSDQIIESVFVVTSQGQRVLQKSYNQSKCVVRTDMLTAGIYMVGIKTINGISWHKVIMAK